MANVLSDIGNLAGNVISGVGQFGGDVLTGLGNFSKAYQAQLHGGPFAMENQQLRKMQILDQIKRQDEADKARTAYYEYLKEKASKPKEIELSDLNKTMETLNTLRFNQSLNLSSEAKSELDNLIKQTQSLITKKIGAKPNVYDRTVEDVNAVTMAAPIMQQTPTIPQQTGALSNISPPAMMGPPRPTGFINPRPQGYLTMGQSTGLEEIWDELDDQSKRGAMELLAQGENPKDIIAFYKKKKGK